jgi:hypothetical protein
MCNSIIYPMYAEYCFEAITLLADPSPSATAWLAELPPKKALPRSLLVAIRVSRYRCGSNRFGSDVAGHRTRVGYPAGRLRETIRNPLVVSALQASQELGHDKIPLRAAGVRWIPSALAKLW